VLRLAQRLRLVPSRGGICPRRCAVQGSSAREHPHGKGVAGDGDEPRVEEEIKGGDLVLVGESEGRK
jgi:hypothetical protein